MTDEAMNLTDAAISRLHALCDEGFNDSKLLDDAGDIIEGLRGTISTLRTQLSEAREEAARNKAMLSAVCVKTRSLVLVKGDGSYTIETNVKPAKAL